MSNVQTRLESVPIGGVSSIAVWELRQAVQQHLIQKDVGRFYNVTVTEDRNRLTLSGTVDSVWTHGEILAMVPDEERCVADHIQVVGTSVLQQTAV